LSKPESLMEFKYTESFQAKIANLHRGKENLPGYESYIRAHLGGPSSRLIRYINTLIPEIQYHCGSLKHKQVLDFGCGTGATAVALAMYSDSTSAFDVDLESVHICEHRLREHGIENQVKLYHANDIDDVKGLMGTFDLILLNGVIEHIPLTKTGMRKRLLRTIFTELLNQSGYMVISETPNRLWPFDFHTTQLWWIPWTRPGSSWAYTRAVKKGRHVDSPTTSEGSLGLEERGAWGETYWEIRNYLKDITFTCVNLQRGHNRRLHYSYRETWKEKLFATAMYYSAVKLLHVPICAFTPGISNLILKKAA